MSNSIVTTNKQKQSIDFWGRISFIATGFLFAFSFPCCEIAEFAYFFAVPFLVWGYNCNNKKALKWSAFAAGWIGWLLTLFFLRHVWFGFPYVAGAYGGLYLGLWLYVATIGLKKLADMRGITRLIGILGLAGFWVVLEWLRGWLFSGYPWLPLAASQWQKPVVLQFLPFTGSYGLSFVLILFNLIIASFIIQVTQRIQVLESTLHRTRLINSEAYVGLALMVLAMILFLTNLPEKKNQEFAFKAGLVQTNIEARLKWDADFFWKNLQILKEETMKVKEKDPDLIIWPESAIPTALNNDIYMLPWMQRLVNEVNIPFLVGAIASESENAWYNAIFEVKPQTGLSPIYYAKQKRVPFGEYVPFREFLPFINKIVPTEFEISPGSHKDPLTIQANHKDWKIGCLVCYEDIFSYLTRETVKRGADFLLVITNDAWYRGEGGAYQHASNSVLRAVESRRPVIRCGNDGWSGWIDEFGNIRGVLTNGLGKIYMRGNAVFPIYYDAGWKDKLSFYVQFGDWFVILSLVLTLLAIIVTWKKQ